MSKAMGLQKGFTLVEVLVILAILAILAGVLVPAVIQNVSKSDVTKVNSDIAAIRTGIETFAVDVKRYPGDIQDLFVDISTADSVFEAVDGNTYPSGLTSKWNGPYVSGAAVQTAADSISMSTGFGGSIDDTFYKKSLSSDAAATYMAVRIRNVGSADVTRLDNDIDNGDGDAAGRVQWTTGVTCTSTSCPFFFLLLPDS